MPCVCHGKACKGTTVFQNKTTPLASPAYPLILAPNDITVNGSRAIYRRDI